MSKEMLTGILAGFGFFVGLIIIVTIIWCFFIFISGHVQRDVDWHSGRIWILCRTYNHCDDNLVFFIFISGHVQRDVDWHSGRFWILRRTYNHCDDNLVFLLWDWLSEEKSKYESCAIVTRTHLIPQSAYSWGHYRPTSETPF